MIRPIVKDVLFLEQKSEPATKEDKSIVTDLIDTLKANPVWKLLQMKLKRLKAR